MINDKEVFECACGDHCFVRITKGFTVIADVEDKAILAGLRWTASIHKHHVYAIAWRDGKTVRLHREIMKAPSTVMVDHKSGNGLDNRKRNLRNATNAQNSANRLYRRRTTKSGFSGVKKRSNKWEAVLSDGHDGYLYLGLHSTPEAAARARDAKALEVYGDFAFLNFPREGSE